MVDYGQLSSTPMFNRNHFTAPPSPKWSPPSPSVRIASEKIPGTFKILTLHVGLLIHTCNSRLNSTCSILQLLRPLRAASPYKLYVQSITMKLLKLLKYLSTQREQKSKYRVKYAYFARSHTLRSPKLGAR